MDYQGDIIRPPSEANAIILQVTVGCSHNHCTFCGAYRDAEKRFRIKNWNQIEEDLRFAATYCGRLTTVFLADGDAFCLPDAQLIRLLQAIRTTLPWVRRVSAYATCQDVLRKSDAQLRSYRELGLTRLYLGLESGYDPTLAAIGKGVTSNDMILAGQRLRVADIFLSVTCLLGIAGIEQSLAHAQATADTLNQMQPHQIAVLTLMLLPNTPLYQEYMRGAFVLPDQKGLFLELRTLLAGLREHRTQFYANHASNYFSLSGRLPRDKDQMLCTIDQALAGTLPLTPDCFRGL